MGWCGGTEVFDDIVDAVMRENIDDFVCQNIIMATIEALWSQDWDCEMDSANYDNPTVKAAFHKLGENSE